MLKNKKVIIVIIAIAAILIVLSIVAFVLIKNKSKNPEKPAVEESIDKAKLEIEFKQPFKNEETEYIEIRQKVEQSKVGKYDILAFVPKLTIEEEEAKNINAELYSLSASIINEAIKAEKYEKYNMEYTSFVNNNILSLVIRYTVKEGDKPRRTIIKTYNYDIRKDERVQITDILDREQRKQIQEEIQNKVQEANKMANKSISQGYNAYLREEDSDIYKIENATEFFIGNDNVLYIIYAYGNQEYTEEMDLIIHKL